MESGVVFNIQRFSLHDGPGIRTVVFLKGCPLRCRWCHNPEGLRAAPELVIHKSRCIGCSSCRKVCPNSAITPDPTGVAVASDRCRLCRKCAGACPTGAIEPVGRRMTAEAVVAEVLKDLVFFTESGGGVTVSGGEPLMQPDFLVSLLKKCRDAGLHTTVETSGYAGRDVLKRVAGVTDLFLYDLKLADRQKSRKFTGKSNKMILANLRWLARTHPDVTVRIPVIPTVNDDEESVRRFGLFLRELGLKNVHLLPYHNTGADKYAKVGLTYRFAAIVPPTPEQLARFKELLREYNLNAETMTG